MITPAASPANPSAPLAATGTDSTSSKTSAPSGPNNSTPPFNAPLEFFKMAMSMMGGGTGISGLGLSPLSDPRLTRYAQAIKNFEVARQMQLWLASGAPVATAQANAEAYVSRTLENPPYSLCLYAAAARAMNIDAASGGRNFQASVAQGALELYNQSNAAASHFAAASAGVASPLCGTQIELSGSGAMHTNMGTASTPVSANLYGGTYGVASPCSIGKSVITTPMNNSTQQESPTAAGFGDGWMKAAAASIPPVQAPPPPPSETMSGGTAESGYPNLVLTNSGRVDGKPSRSLLTPNASRFDAELKNITLPSNLATRVLATKWIQSTYQTLVKRAPTGMSEPEWHQRLCTFIRAVVEGLARYPEEGCAMRWLSLPTASPDLVVGVSNEPERYSEELPGFYGKPDASSANGRTSTSTSSPTAYLSEQRKTLWVPPTRSTVSLNNQTRSAGNETASASSPDSSTGSRSVSLSSLSSLTSGGPNSAERKLLKRREVDINSEKGSSKKRRREKSHPSATSGSPTAPAGGFIPISDSLPAAFTSAKSDALPTQRWKQTSKHGKKTGRSLGVEANSSVQTEAAPETLYVEDPREIARRQARAMRFSGGGEVIQHLGRNTSLAHDGPSTSVIVGHDSNVPHAFPFSVQTESTSASPSPNTQPLRPMTWQEKLAVITSTQKVVGMSTAVEKSYLRLCGPPDPVLVRSESALHKSFFYVMRKFLRLVLQSEASASPKIAALMPPGAESSAAASSPVVNMTSHYHYIDEQLRSIRQDFVVQGIQTPFLYFVYSINARISQIFQDLGQFNQCQSQMKQLERLLPYEISQNVEFLSYRLLYAALNGLDSDFSKLEMTLRQERNLDVLKNPAVQFAIKIRNLLIDQNYTRYFRMTTPRMDCDQTLEDDKEKELQVLQSLIEEFSKAWESFQSSSSSQADTADSYRQQMDLIASVSQNVWQRYNFSLGPPYMCRTLLRVAAPRFRMAFVCLLAKSHYTLNVSHMTEWLGMSTDQECEAFLRSQSAIFSDQCVLDCRKSYPLFLQSSLLSKKVKAMG